MFNFLLNNTPLLYWTQSLWRDEAFSVWIASGSLKDVITRTAGDFNPPLYYLLLNIWLHIFGRSEIALRGLSFIFFLVFLMFVYKFALVLFKSKSHAQLTTLIMGLNPMLLYFAFELRMYSLLVLLSAAATYFLYTKNWKWYILAAAAGLYTQPFMAFVLIGHGFYFLLSKQIKTTIWVFAAIGMLFLPWVPTILNQFKHSGPMWMWPVDRNTFETVLGNVFMGYEGTPGGLWNWMKLISLLIFGATFFAWKQKKLRPAILLFCCLTYVPLLLVLIISLKKPIYVHRYVIFTTIGEVFLLSCFLFQFKKLPLKMVTLVIGLLLIGGNLWAASFHHKVDFQQTFANIRPQLTAHDIVIAADPLCFFESRYYTPMTTKVYLYNPDSIDPPLFTGAVGMPKTVWISQYPQFPQRAFVVSDDGSYKIISRVVNQ